MPACSWRVGVLGDVFTISGVPLGKDAVVIGAGLDLHVTPRVTASVAYDGKFGLGATDAR